MLAASLTTRPQGSERLGSTKAAGVSIPAARAHRPGGSPAGGSPRRGRSARSLVSIRPACGPSPQRTRSHRSVGAGLVAIAGEGLDQADQVLLGDEAADRQEERSLGQALPSFGMVAPGSRPGSGRTRYRPRCSPGRCVGRHPELDQVVAMARTADQGGVEQADPAALDQLLPPGSRPVDRLALGHQDRRPAVSPGPAGRGHRLGPGIADDPHGIGLVAVESPDHGRGAVGGLSGSRGPIGEQGDPVERLGLLPALPGIGPLAAGHLVGDQAITARREAGSARARSRAR